MSEINLNASKGYPMQLKKTGNIINFIDTAFASIGDKLFLDKKTFIVDEIIESRQPNGVFGVHSKEAMFYSVKASEEKIEVKQA